MKEVLIPSDGALQIKKSAALAGKRRACGIFSFVLAALAILCFIGALICLILTEFGERSKATETLLYILSGSLAGGAVLVAVFAVLFSKLMQSAYQTELDYRERLDSENSFFVGDGTLATFEKSALRIHAEDGKGEKITVPYSEIRFFSVCTRRVPREKGEWSVVMEVPVKYLARKGENTEDGPALIQTDAKERLYRVIEEKGLTLLGARETAEKGKKFVALQKYPFPNREGRKQALIQLGLGIVLMGAGVGVGFWQLTIGVILGAFGAFIAARAVASYLRKKSVLSFYEEGLYWKEENRNDSVFLKWDEIEGISEEEKNGFRLLRVTCPYGAYHFLNREGVFEYLQQTHPEKCVEYKR